MLAVGVDLGGTKIAAGLFDDQGELRSELQVRPTRADEASERTMAELLDAVRAAIGSTSPKKLIGIGVGTTGPLDPFSGELLEPETLPNLFHFPLGERLTQELSLPFAMTNDANSFALSEAMYGAGRGKGIVLGVTLGTGCGVGVVMEGKVHEGATASAGEVYRAKVRDRTFDEALSGVGLSRICRDRFGEDLAGAELTRRADDGDAKALEVFLEFGSWLASGLGILISVIDPHVVVLGGSVSRAYEYFEASLRAELGEYVAPAAASVLIEVAAESDLTGARGAAALAFSRL